MSRNLLSTILRSLEAQDNIVFGFDELRSYLPEDIAALKQAKILVEAGTCSYVTCDECGEYHTAEVHWLEGADGRRVKPFYECTVDPSVGRVWLKLDQLQQLEASFSNLCDFIAQALCTKLDLAPVVTNRLVKLGHLATSDGRDVRLFVARGLRRLDAAKTLMPHIAQLRNTAIIVTGPPAADLQLQASSFAIQAAELISISPDVQALLASSEPILCDAMAPSEVGALTGNIFLDRGDFWEIIFEGEKTLLKHGRGIEHLAQLIEAQGRDIAALTLYSSNKVNASSHSGFPDEPLPNGIMPTSGHRAQIDDYDGDRVTDKVGLGIIRSNIQRLERQLAAARLRGDAPQALELAEELERAEKYLAMSTNGKGNARRQIDAGESASNAVQQAIRRLLKEMETKAPRLQEHLMTSLRIGAVLSYSPKRPTKWTLEK